MSPRTEGLWSARKKFAGNAGAPGRVVCSGAPSRLRCAGQIRVLTGNVWAGVGFQPAFQVVAQRLLSRDLFEVDGTDTVMGPVFPLRLLLPLPFALGVTVTMLLIRVTGTWPGKVPEPAE